MRRLLQFALLLAVGAAGHAQAPPAYPAAALYQPTTCKNSFTVDEELEQGDKVARAVYRQMPVLPDSDPLSRYVQQLGARLVAAAPPTPGLDQQWPFRFHVVASQEINAFALPGGTMFVNLGAINAAENEAQLAGIMGHEMSHVILRHSTCNLTRQAHRSVWYGLGQIGASMVLGGTAGDLAAAGIGMGKNLDFLHMSRGDEQQADLLGVQIAHDAGFDPRGLPQFFEIIASKTGKGGAQFLSDHPNPGNRTQYVNAEIAAMGPVQGLVKTSPGFQRAHQLAATMPVFDSDAIQAGGWRDSGWYAISPESGPGRVPPPPPPGRPQQ